MASSNNNKPSNEEEKGVSYLFLVEGNAVTLMDEETGELIHFPDGLPENLIPPEVVFEHNLPIQLAATTPQISVQLTTPQNTGGRKRRRAGKKKRGEQPGKKKAPSSSAKDDVVVLSDDDDDSCVLLSSDDENTCLEVTPPTQSTKTTPVTKQCSPGNNSAVIPANITSPNKRTSPKTATFSVTHFTSPSKRTSPSKKTSPITLTSSHCKHMPTFTTASTSRQHPQVIHTPLRQHPHHHSQQPYDYPHFIATSKLQHPSARRLNLTSRLMSSQYKSTNSLGSSTQAIPSATQSTASTAVQKSPVIENIDLTQHAKRGISIVHKPSTMDTPVTEIVSMDSSTEDKSLSASKDDTSPIFDISMCGVENITLDKDKKIDMDENETTIDKNVKRSAEKTARISLEGNKRPSEKRKSVELNTTNETIHPNVSVDIKSAVCGQNPTETINLDSSSTKTFFINNPNKQSVNIDLSTEKQSTLLNEKLQSTNSNDKVIVPESSEEFSAPCAPTPDVISETSLSSSGGMTSSSTSSAASLTPEKGKEVTLASDTATSSASSNDIGSSGSCSNVAGGKSALVVDPMEVDEMSPAKVTSSFSVASSVDLSLKPMPAADVVDLTRPNCSSTAEDKLIASADSINKTVSIATSHENILANDSPLKSTPVNDSPMEITVSESPLSEKLFTTVSSTERSLLDKSHESEGNSPNKGELVNKQSGPPIYNVFQKSVDSQEKGESTISEESSDELLKREKARILAGASSYIACFETQNDVIEQENDIIEQPDDVIEPENDVSMTDEKDGTHIRSINYNLETLPKEVIQVVDEFSHAKTENFLRGCLWSPDGSMLVTNSNDNILRIFTLPSDILQNESAKMKKTVRIKEGETIYSMAWYPFMTSVDPTTTLVVSTSRDRPIHLWDALTGEHCCSYRAFDQMDELTSALSVTFNSEGSKIYAGFNKCMRVFDSSRPGRECTQIDTFTRNKKGGRRKCQQSGIISSIDFPFTYNGCYATGSFGKTVGLYDVHSDRCVTVMEGHKGGVTQVKFSYDGCYLFSGGRKDNEILAWDMRSTNSPVFRLSRDVTTNQRIQFDIDRSDSYIFSGNTSASFTFYNLHEVFSSLHADQLYTPTRSFDVHRDAVNSVSVHPTLPLLATTSGKRHFTFDADESEGPMDNSLRIWKI